MSLTNLSKFKILEFISINLNSIQFAVLIVALIEFLFLNIFLDRKKICSFFLGFYSLLISPVDHPCSVKDEYSNSKKEKDTDDEQIVRRGDVEMVLTNLGISYNDDDDDQEEENNIPDPLDSDEIFNIFEDKNVSVDEMRDAFEVFDENRDGFIDANELGKVLCALGLHEGSDVEGCRRMIAVFDENGDGRIDFHEFVKFMGE